MKPVAISLLPLLLLAACGTTDVKPYRDTALLERPPTLTTTRTPAAQRDTEESATDAKEAQTGLGDKVYMTEASPPQLRIRQPFDEAWTTLAQALRQMEIKVTDKNREERVYYAAFDADNSDGGFFGQGIFSIFRNDDARQTYMLKLEDRDQETEVSAELSNKPDEKNDSGSRDEGSPSAPADGADKLLKTLYKTLHDDLKKE